MALFSSLLTLCSVILVCFGGSWSSNGEYFYFLLDVGINDPSAAYATGGADGIGAIVLKTSDLGLNFTILETRDGLIDIGCSTFNSNDAVIAGVAGEMEYTTDGGQTFTVSEDIVAGSQSISRTRSPNTIYGAAGGGFDGMATSSDLGVTWQHFEGNISFPRYVAMASDTTYFVSAGIWEDESLNYFDKNSFKSINSKVGYFYDNNSKKYKFRFKYHDHDGFTKRNTYKNGGRRVLQDDLGMFGAIWRTTDSGNSFERVFFNANEFYFNAIDCCDVNTCYAVAEGDEESGSDNPGTKVFMTTDGGDNWSQIYNNPADTSSLMVVHCVSDSEAWVGGGNIDFVDFYGNFLYTDNSGKNWTEYKVDSPVMFMDMTDDSMYGFASGLTRSGQGEVYGYQ